RVHHHTVRVLRFACLSATSIDHFHQQSPIDGFDLGNVPAWLKSLRLHKYTAMFAELSYEQMMALDEAELERRNVTKGARTKILQSIQKLRNRAADLRAMHEKLSLSHPERCLRCAIASLRQMIAAPMIPYKPVAGESSNTIDGFAPLSCISDQNVPGLIFNLLGEVQRAVFVSRRQPMDIEYEYLMMLFTIFDKLCNNEAFTPMQRQRVHQWKRLARKAIRPTDVRRRRIGFLHSGKCENCHYKVRENGIESFFFVFLLSQCYFTYVDEFTKLRHKLFVGIFFSQLGYLVQTTLFRTCLL
ncbi:unnamed protein product, partial [Angiostrongylus costaricensis]|uniref:SAM domain-containing protein n=1 Tax=Angiostrongylus costaricensis TaxID=334426 RepID=A0A0R3PQ67_ANGCS